MSTAADPVLQAFQSGTPVETPTTDTSLLESTDPVAKAFQTGKPITSSASSVEAPALPETTGRVAGLGERALIKGLGSLVDVPGALVSLADRAGMNAHNYIRGLFGLEPDATPGESIPAYGSRGAAAASDALGLPTAQTRAERLGTAAVAGTPAALLAPETPFVAALSGASGGVSSQAAAEAGAGPLGQAVAGFAGGALAAVPSAIAVGTRAALRGGESGRLAVQQSIDDFNAAGTTPTVGQAGNRLATGLENTVANMPGGAGVMDRAAASQRGKLARTFDDIVSGLSAGREPTATAAGEVLAAGTKHTVAQVRADSKAAYEAVDALVPPGTAVAVSKTAQTLQKLTTPVAGAEATTGSLISPKLKTLADNLEADLKNNGGTLPYGAVTRLKTSLGDQIDWSPFPTDPANGQLKQVYNALRDDINAGASASSPEAAAAVRSANALYTANKTKLDELESIVNRNGGPEAIFNAALSGTGPKGGPTVVTRAMAAMNPEQQNLFAAAVLKRMGTGAPGSTDAEAFDPNRFLTNWNKMNSEAKSALFDKLPNNFRENLDKLASTIDTVKASNRVLANPSGSGRAIAHNALLADLVSSVPIAFVAPHVAVGQVVAGGGTAALANIAARALTSPKAVQWLAQKTATPLGAVAGSISAGTGPLASGQSE